MSTPLFRSVSMLLPLALATGLALQTSADPMESPHGADGKKSPSQAPLLDDLPLLIFAKPELNEADRDKLEAIALFSAARALENRQQYGDALQLYQRALRYDPQSAEIARAIVPLAIQLKREGVAIRYALKAAELDEDLDPILLRRLAVRLEEEGDWPKALKLFQRALAMHHDDKPISSEVVLLRMETGRLLCLAERFNEAAECFAVVADALDHPEKYALAEEIKKALLEEAGITYAMFGDCFLKAGRTEEARSAYEGARRLQPNEELWNFHLAQVLVKKGETDQALAALEAALAKHLSIAGMRPYELLEEVLDKLDKKEELIPRLEKLHAEDPLNVPLGYFLAGKYLEVDSLDKAEPLYVALVEKTPTRTGFISLAELYRKTKRYDALLSVLGETVEKTGVLDTLGSEAILLSKNADVMRGLIESAHKEKLKEATDKSSFGRCFALGLLALDGKQWETAREFFQAAASADSKQAAEVYLVWGIGLLVDDRAAEAAEVFQQGIDRKALPENNPTFYYYLAGALAQENRIPDALAAAGKAAEIKKDSVRFRSRIPWVYYRAKQYDDAVREYMKLLDQFDENYDSDENRKSLKEVRVALSNICVLQNKISDAQQWLEQVLDEFPDDIGAMNDLGYLWADDNRNLSRALNMIRKAIDAEPDNGAYRDSLGWVLYRLGRYDEAIAELEKAADLQSDAVIFDHLGDAYKRLNQSDKARHAWLRAAELYRKENDENKATEAENKMRNIE